MKSLLAKGTVVLGAVGLALAINGCTPDISPLAYTTGQTGVAARTEPGVVVAATPVSVRNSTGRDDGIGIGSVGGALAGGIAGSAIGGGARANALGAVGGALLGGVLGNVAQNKLTQQTGMQYEVRLRHGGSIVSVTQGMSPAYAVGQKVFVIFSNPARIVADMSGA